MKATSMFGGTKPKNTTDKPVRQAGKQINRAKNAGGSQPNSKGLSQAPLKKTPAINSTVASQDGAAKAQAGRAFPGKGSQIQDGGNGSNAGVLAKNHKAISRPNIPGKVDNREKWN